MLSYFKYFNWQLTIGDPTVMGWLTVIAYICASSLCTIYAINLTKLPKISFNQQEYYFWIGLAGIMFFLGVNRQLNLLSLFTEIGRSIAYCQGWYEQRRIFQKWFVLLLAFGGNLLLILLMWKFRHNIKHYVLPLTGIISLMTFNIIRSISHHKIDVLLQRRMAGVKLNWVLELSGIALVALAALFKCRGL